MASSSIISVLQKIVQEISLELRFIDFGFDEKLVGMETRVEDVVSSFEVGTDEVRMIGITGMGGAGKTTLARAVFDHLSNDFEAKSFVGNVREVSKASMFGLENLQEQVLSDVLNEQVTVNGVIDGIKVMKERMRVKKVLLVLDDVDHIEQLEALAGDPNWFKPGSRILITTRDEQVLLAHKVHLIRDINLLSDKEAICLLSRYAFEREIPSQGYEELSEKVVSYASGLPLTVKVLGSLLCGNNELEWVDAIERLEKIPLEETMAKLELSYIGLEDDYKEIFLDIACILKGKMKEDAIRILESCGFHGEVSLRVLERRSLINVDEYGRLDMHDHIEQMGKNIVRRLHPNEPNKHSRLWINEEIEAILADDMGTEETRRLKVDAPRLNSRILMEGLGKMKKLRYLEVNFAYYDSETDCESDVECLDDTSQYFPNSLRYLKCTNYPFLYLPITFQANNLVGLEMQRSRMVQLWEEGEKKVLKKLKFLSLYKSQLTTFDFRMTPNLNTLILRSSDKLVELCCPVSCLKLKHLDISDSKLRTFDLGLTPNLETLSLDNCADFEELHVSVACPNLKFLHLRKSRLRILDLELIPNLESLDLAGCYELVEINDPDGCLKKVGFVNLSGCLRFSDSNFYGREPKDNSMASSSNISVQKSFKYDVFISFRGEDTGKYFVNYLYEALKDKGIETYKDDQKIKKGGRISDDIFEAIEDSKFHIIVFSKNYASSSWCLDELVKIMECHKMPGHTAYPVFYDVEPTEVRKQSEAVGEAFAKHENEEATEKWREALKEASNLAGWDLKNTLDGGQDEFIQLIVDKMSLELHYGVDANSVGMVTRVKDYFIQFIDMLSPVLNKLVEEMDLNPGVTFSFIVTCLLALIGIKSQNVTGFPFNTHPNAIKVPVASLLIYAFASMAKHAVSVARLHHTSVYAIIASLGRISSVCLFVTSLAILICI